MAKQNIDVKSTGGEKVAAGNPKVSDFLHRGSKGIIVWMRGLPFGCDAHKVIEFFRSDQNGCSCEVLGGEEGVLLVKKANGSPTGNAFALFANESEVENAIGKHCKRIGSRYIEIYLSTKEKVQQVLDEADLPAHILPQHVFTSGTQKDCIQLHGLPFKAKTWHILDFLGDHAKNILRRGVHIIHNPRGRPSGNAFIRMVSEESANYAAITCHGRRMTVDGEKYRYIKVYQCSGDDMHFFITGHRKRVPNINTTPYHCYAAPPTFSGVNQPAAQVQSGMQATATLVPYAVLLPAHGIWPPLPQSYTAHAQQPVYLIPQQAMFQPLPAQILIPHPLVVIGAQPFHMPPYPLIR